MVGAGVVGAGVDIAGGYTGGATTAAGCELGHVRIQSVNVYPLDGVETSSAAGTATHPIIHFFAATLDIS
jgi:hypothetical protein